MEGAHQPVHQDHSTQRRRVLRRAAEPVQGATTTNAGQQRHGGERRRGREAYPIVRATSARIVRPGTLIPMRHAPLAR